MRQSAIISMYGLWLQSPTLFNGLQLPAAVPRETVVNNVLMQSLDREVLYPNPQFLAFAIGAYSEMRRPVWQHLADTLNYDYNPISNYDRTEIGSDESGEENSGTRSNSGTETNSGSNSSKSSETVNRFARGSSEASETRDNSGTESGTSSENIKTDYTRDLTENTTGSTSSNNKSVLSGGETSTNSQTVNESENSSGHQTGTDSETNSGQDIVTVEEGAYNLQPGMASAQRSTTQFGKSTSGNHSQDTTGEITSESTTSGSNSVDRNSTTTETGSGSSTGEVKQTGTTGETKTGKSEFSNKTTDTGTTATKGSSSSQEGSEQSSSNTGDYTDEKETKFNETTTGQATRKTQHNLRAYGNIGVTTTQTLIKEEREIAEFNIIEYIVDDLIRHFCLLIY